LIGNHLGDFQTLMDNYLPKPAIDRTTFRMAELLKSRWGGGLSAGLQGQCQFVIGKKTKVISRAFEGIAGSEAYFL